MIRNAVPHLFTVAAAVVAGCGNPRSAGELQPFEKVRVTARALGPGWHVAEVGSIGECTVLLVPEPADAPVRLIPVSLDDVTELQRSGSAAAEAPRGADSSEGEAAGDTWTPMDLAALRRQYGGCSAYP